MITPSNSESREKHQIEAVAATLAAGVILIVVVNHFMWFEEDQERRRKSVSPYEAAAEIRRVEAENKKIWEQKLAATEKRQPDLELVLEAGEISKWITPSAGWGSHWLTEENHAVDQERRAWTNAPREKTTIQYVLASDPDTIHTKKLSMINGLLSKYRFRNDDEVRKQRISVWFISPDGYQPIPKYTHNGQPWDGSVGMGW